MTQVQKANGIVTFAKVTGLHLWDAVLYLALFGAVLFFADDRIQSFFEDVADGPPNVIEVQALYYESGLIYQQVGPSRGGIIPANWSAALYQANDFRALCNGGGSWDYGVKYEPVGMTPSFWTNDDCPDLIDGQEYIARAKWWHYLDVENGEDRFTVTQEFRFTHEGTAP